MKIAIGSDERTHLTDIVIEELKQRGHEVLAFGSLLENESEVDCPARGARIWQSANVLVLSLRATTEAVAKEILDAWFATSYSNDEWNLSANRTYTTARKNLVRAS